MADHDNGHLPTDGHSHDGDDGTFWLRRYGRFHDHVLNYVNVQCSASAASAGPYRSVYSRPDNS